MCTLLSAVTICLVLALGNTYTSEYNAMAALKVLQNLAGDGKTYNKQSTQKIRTNTLLQKAPVLNGPEEIAPKSEHQMRWRGGAGGVSLLSP